MPTSHIKFVQRISGTERTDQHPYPWMAVTTGWGILIYAHGFFADSEPITSCHGLCRCCSSPPNRHMICRPDSPPSPASCGLESNIYSTPFTEPTLRLRCLYRIGSQPLSSRIVFDEQTPIFHSHFAIKAGMLGRCRWLAKQHFLRVHS